MASVDDGRVFVPSFSRQIPVSGCAAHFTRITIGVLQVTENIQCVAGEARIAVPKNAVMSTYGTAVIADTATPAEGQAMTANLKKLAAMTLNQHSLNPPTLIGQWWRTKGYVRMSVAEMVGTGL